MADAKKRFQVVTRKFMVNRLLNRRQFVVDVHHPGLANVSKADIQASIARSYKVSDPKTVFLFGFRTQFGGGKSTGFGLIYDSIKFAQKYEPTYRQVRAGQEAAKKVARKQRKERKNKGKKVRGTGEREKRRQQKKSQES